MRHDRARVVLISLLLGTIFVGLLVRAGPWPGSPRARGCGFRRRGRRGVGDAAPSVLRQRSERPGDRAPAGREPRSAHGVATSRLRRWRSCWASRSACRRSSMARSTAYIQVLKPVPPLAWMPLFLYTLKDWAVSDPRDLHVVARPTLANTTFGVASMSVDYLNVAAILQLGWLRGLLTVVLPAAAPAIVAGLRISIGSAWIQIVAAECSSAAPASATSCGRVEQPAAHERHLRDPRDRTDQRAARRRPRAPVARARLQR